MKENKTLKVTWVKSAIGYNKNQSKVLEALGFKKLNQTRILPDNESIRGSLFHIKHLVEVSFSRKKHGTMFFCPTATVTAVAV